jgi:hypothetical protein
MQYYVRGGELHATTWMRSNDLWLGFPYDLYNFCRLQAYVAAALDLPVGSHTHLATSLHLYEHHWDAAEEAIQAHGPRAVEILPDPHLTYPVPTSVRAAFSEVSAAKAAPHGMPESDIDRLSALPHPWSCYVNLLLGAVVQPRDCLAGHAYLGPWPDRREHNNPPKETP